MPIKELTNNPTWAGQLRLIERVAYACADGEPQYLSILAPWVQRYPSTRTTPRPLIVFVQGSSWRLPTLGEQIPQLVDFAKQGYIVATVQHRNSLDGHPFPAFLEDVKTAIRYLRAHAVEYMIDPNRVAIWGTSSGANTALLVGLTGNDQRYQTRDYPDQSDAVSAVVSCFAPTDVQDTFQYTAMVPGNDVLQYALFGPDQSKWDEQKIAMSPVHQIKAGVTYPPFLLFHGDQDKTVPYQEMETMYQALVDQGASVEAYRVKGADHERDFWSAAVYETVLEFLNRYEQEGKH